MHENSGTELSPLRERVSAPPTHRPAHPLVAEWRPATMDDVDAVLDVVRAIDAVEHPNYLATREEVEEELGYSFVDRERDTLIGFAADGRPVAAGIVLEPPRQETLVREFLNGGVHPDFWGRGVGRELLAWQLARGRQKLAASDKRLPGWIVGYADARAPRRERLLRHAGLEPVRYFLTPERSLAVWHALEAGDYARARAIIDSIAPFEIMRTKHRNGANVTVVKEALRLRGHEVGPVRLPGLPELDANDRQILGTVLAQWGQDGLV